ncbi:hypothetical protein DUI87_23419 [Hirundo rustica rustica]|uniref:Uncharacterized protein n=1 Tax=Hirundo rustica rustica TaxID=333673 RepID=A0A3M0JI63_HIRRU|nr:hypothetical protein DUI87_23419 [Hirundo rustica rustica]
MLGEAWSQSTSRETVNQDLPPPLNKTIFSSARLAALEQPQDSRAWTARHRLSEQGPGKRQKRLAKPCQEMSKNPVNPSLLLIRVAEGRERLIASDNGIKRTSRILSSKISSHKDWVVMRVIKDRYGIFAD